MKFAVAIFCLLGSAQALAWGGRGHHSICSVAVHLVKNDELREFLKVRPNIMGHICNVPDIYWRSLPPEVSKSGDASHYIHLEMTGFPEEVSEDFLALNTKLLNQTNLYTKKLPVKNVADEVGSVWWRADQFDRRIKARKDAFASVVPPKDRKEEQDEKLAYNKEIYDMMVNMGLMGHFVGDAGQPYHAVADYDGWDAGHGGLHSFYEDASVGAAPADLEARIFTAAHRMQNQGWLKEKSVVARMKQMSIFAKSDVKDVLRLDPMTKKSEIKTENGKEARTKAERQSAEIGWKKFNSLIVNEMARSAVLLAKLWDEEYEAVGKPKLAAYRSYRFPFTPEFVPLDYATAMAPTPTSQK